MNSTIIVSVLVAYFGVLYLISRITGKNDGNDAFLLEKDNPPGTLLLLE